VCTGLTSAIEEEPRVTTPASEPNPRPTEIFDGRLLIAIGPELETCVVTLVGELDYGNVPTLEYELHRLLARDLDLLLDLEGLGFIDSSGIKCLMQMTGESRANGDRFRILGPLHPHVDRVLRISGAHDVLPFVGGAAGSATTRRAYAGP
jgi:anti-anti-sigma factor